MPQLVTFPEKEFMNLNSYENKSVLSKVVKYIASTHFNGNLYISAAKIFHINFEIPTNMDPLLIIQHSFSSLYSCLVTHELNVGLHLES